jgi:hypothetical protein
LVKKKTPLKKSKRKNSREIGARLEREVANALTLAGFPARRGQQRSGLDENDVLCESLAPWFRLECKRSIGNWTPLYAAVAQCHRDADLDQAPMVFVHAPAKPGEARRPVLVVFEFDDAIELIRAWMDKWGGW